MNPYDHTQVEKKWQDIWESAEPNKVSEDPSKPKFYALIEFPYPSGAGLHVGHIRSNTAMDVIARKRRMEGFNVLYPIGWDAFGLPAENYAIKTGIQPAIVTKQNIDNFRRQLKLLGFSFDWSREVDTTDPKYFKWTQWIFLQFLKKGLAYKKRMDINWCPKDLIGLANEEVVNGCCERCGTAVVKKEKEQWMLAITKYAERLDKDLDETDFQERIKIQQRNWIGKSEGAEIDFPIKGSRSSIKVYTTRPDTLHGVTYIVLSPEHSFVEEHISFCENTIEIAKYIVEVKGKTEIERTDAKKEKTGVQLKGIIAINPINNEEIPVWIADYVLSDYGTGAIMAVPAHDERDRQFAEKYSLDIKEIEPGDKKTLTEQAGGKLVTKFKLRDWVFSRQRYWGEPIPVVHCDKCGIVPLPEKDLPLELPKVENYAPTQNGESPLSAISEWVNTKCPECKGDAKRETDTMPNWAGSSWYYLRYTDPNNKNAFADQSNLKYWTPVDWYNGGMEHTTLHLLYSRFWHKFLYDLELVPTKEPYKKRTSHGLILAEGGAKMSKSVGNVVNPDDIVKTVGADTLRVHEMFMGPFEQAIAWDTNSIAGSRRFIERIWKLQTKIGDTQSERVEVQTHKTIKKVTEDIESMGFNTAISSIMILINEIEKEDKVTRSTYEIILKLIAPFAPHVTEELWNMLGNNDSIHSTKWPIHDESKLLESNVKIVIQINGKMRGEMVVASNMDEAKLEEMALNMDEIKKWLVDKIVIKVIVIKNKLVNIVIK